jgi:N6-L-threonylcarbamoyladenine synthase
MKILAIETSCDETAIAILEAPTLHTKSKRDKLGSRKNIGTSFKILSSVVLSQIATHRPFGGVVPNLAMREHQKNLVPILESALTEAGLLKPTSVRLSPKESGRWKIKSGQNKAKLTSSLATILHREPILRDAIEPFFKKYDIPDIDAIAVTQGPGLEPALWVGINFAKALSAIWQKPLIPVNHLEGHIYANFLPKTRENTKCEILNSKEIFPALALIVSGGHTELLLVKNHLRYQLLGETRDDAVGEAFDKVAKMLGLGYPGGPEISKIAELGNEIAFDFPRPMINSGDFDFSFSGLKTSVLYTLQDLAAKKTTKKRSHVAPIKISTKRKADIAASFQQAAVDVLIKKSADALKKYKPKSLVVGGGVIANKKLRSSLETLVEKLFPDTKLYLAPLWLTGDNAAMIAAAAFFRGIPKKKVRALSAEGNLKLSA